MFAVTQPNVFPLTPKWPVPKDSDTSTVDRPWIKVRMPKGSADVKGIMDSWLAKKEAAPNLALAIRLLNALKQGDLAAAREIFPLLGLIINPSGKTQKRKVAPPLPSESDSLKEDQQEEKGGALTDMMIAIGKVTEIDVQVNERRIKILARKLVEANYTPDDLHKWLESCWKREWPGDKGDTPTLKELQERIGRVRTMPASLEKDYTRGLPAYAAFPPAEALEPAVEAVEEEEELPPPKPPPAWNMPGYIRAKWQAIVDEMRIRMTPSTFIIGFGHTRPLHYAGDEKSGTLYIEVQEQYAKDRLEQHLLDYMNSLFDKSLNYRWDAAARRHYPISPTPLFRIEIIVEGDLIAPECLTANTA